MANEITIATSLSFVKGLERASLHGNDKIDMTGIHYVQRVDDISNVEESVSRGDIVTLGYCMFKNVGDTGVIQVGGVTGAYVVKLDPGAASGAIKWATNAIFAICDLTGGRLEMLLLEL